MDHNDFLGERLVNGVKVRVIKRPLTKEESRRIFHSRPFSKFAESQFGGVNWLINDEALVSSGKGRPCRMCGAVTRNEILLYETCPDCDGRCEAAGANPFHGKFLVECCGGPHRKGTNHTASKGCCGGKNHHR